MYITTIILISIAPRTVSKASGSSTPRSVQGVGRHLHRGLTMDSNKQQVEIFIRFKPYSWTYIYIYYNYIMVIDRILERVKVIGKEQQVNCAFFFL